MHQQSAGDTAQQLELDKLWPVVYDDGGGEKQMGGLGHDIVGNSARPL